MRHVLAFVLILFSLTACKDITSETNSYNIAAKKDAIVAIVATNTAEKKSGLGTGFFIKENYIVTNYHVAGDPTFDISVSTETNGKSYPAEVVYSDKATDIAVIKLKKWDEFIKDNPNVKYLKFADSLPKDTDTVWAIGHPWGLTFSISKGIVSNEARKTPDPIPTWWIQTDAHVYEGNSGGPLLNDNGDVVGIDSNMIAQTGGSYGFAIPMTLVKKVLNDLEKYKEVRWPSLGVLLEGPGATVKDMPGDSAAKAAGLQVGDVIVAVKYGDAEETPVKNYYDLIELLSGADYASNIELAVMRKNKMMRLHVQPKFKSNLDYAK